MLASIQNLIDRAPVSLTTMLAAALVVMLAGYLAAFQHGMPPHGGFAIGLERFVARLTETPNIREVALFPRDRTRLTP